MKDEDRTKEQLITELDELHKPVAQFEAAEVERVQAEKSPSLLDESCQGLFEFFPIGITVLDMKGVILYCNAAVFNKGSYSKDDLVGKHFSRIAPLQARDIPNFVRIFASLMRGKVPKPFEVNYQRKGGTTGWTEVSVGLTKVGEERRILVAQNDITERKQAEEIIRREKDQAEQYLNIAGVLLGAVDAGENITMINKRGCEILGYKERELIGKNWFDTLVPQRMRGEIREVFNKLVAGDIEPVEYYENPLLTKDGVERLVAFHNTVIRNPNGEITAVLFSADDITERKQAEEEVIRGRDYLKNLTDSMWDAVFAVKMPERVIEWANDSFRLIGYEPEECIGKTTEFLYPDKEGFLAFGNKLKNATAEGKDVMHTEQLLRRKNGELFPAEITLTFFREKLEIVRATSIVRDITERKKAEAALRQSEEKLRLMFESVTDGITVTNMNGAIIDLNDRTVQLHGFSSKDELLGKSAFELIDPLDQKKAAAFMQKTLEEGAVMGIEYTFLKADGSKFPGELSASVMRDESDNPVGFIAITRDITEHKRAEEKEKQLQQELTLASRLASVGQMASGIAHEINNPLTGVIGFSDLLMKKDLPEDIKKDVEVIQEGAQRVASITRRMLTFAHQHEPERTSVNINEIIETTLATRAYEMESSNIQVTTQLASDIPLTSGDAGQLQQVFLNIILNAEMEMKLAHGRGNLMVKMEKIDNTIRVSFKDDGPGIPRKNLDRLFDPFFTTRDLDKGTGLGLSICYSIVTQHGGKIYARSRLGKGATFFVELPVVTKEEQLKMAEPAAEVSKTLSGARILVVDDDTIVQEFLTTILTEEGHQVEIVENGDDALERVDSEDYDVILLDIRLPGMSGIELYRYMQKTAKSLARRVVFITGDTMSTDTMDFLATAGAPYIAKPFDAEQLKKAVDRILSQQS